MSTACELASAKTSLQVCYNLTCVVMCVLGVHGNISAGTTCYKHALNKYFIIHILVVYILTLLIWNQQLIRLINHLVRHIQGVCKQ